VITPYPDTHGEPGGFVRRNPWVSVDFEFNPTHPIPPTVIGLCSGDRPMSSIYNYKGKAVLEQLEREKVVWVGHNSVTVEKPIIEAELGVTIPLSRVDDTMIWHYLANSHLCKGTTKDEDGEDQGKGQGFMDLWSMSSLYTDLPVWKSCRGVRCAGPCHEHDPLGYNGMDTYAVDLAVPNLKADMKRKGITEDLVTHVKEMMVVCHEMSVRGIKVDRDEVYRLEREMFERKDKLFPSRVQNKVGKKGQTLKSVETVWDAPFNPHSSDQIIAYFSDHGYPLEKTDKESISTLLDHMTARTDRDVFKWAENLYDYKHEGKGLGPWFAERYFSADGLMHPRFNPTGTSFGRLSSSDPNFQNIPGKGFGKNVKRVVVPRDPSLCLAKADKSQLELRIVLWYAGVFEKLPYFEDAFHWLVSASNGLFESVASDNPDKGWDARDWSKSVSHGADYLEGITILYGKDLDSAYTRTMIDKGALVVYRDWEAFGGVVGFTGSNLAKRLFGDKTHENRRKALAIQEAYFNRFPEIRTWHKSITRLAEQGYLKSASGRYLQLFGSPEDKLKQTAAFFGQGGGADDVGEGMRRFGDLGQIPLIQVHDELVFELPVSWSDEKIMEHFQPFVVESKFMSGFKGPVKVSRGPNWLDQRVLGKI
jgi:DNA polymerase I-like protein with 3'-5' exonuclease and polymerase domains